MPPRDDAAEFEGYVRKFQWSWRTVLALIGDGSVFSLLVVGIGPEHTRRTLDVLLSALFSLAAVLAVYVLVSRIARKRIVKWMWISLGVALAACVIYGVLLATFTDSDSAERRYVKGYQYTEEVLLYKTLAREKRAAGEQFADIRSDHDLVIKYQDNPNLVWTPSSIGYMALCVRGTWLLVVASASSFVGHLMLLLPAVPKETEAKKNEPNAS